MHFSTGDLESLSSSTNAPGPQLEREGRRMRALVFIGKGDWKNAEELLRSLADEDQEDFEVNCFRTLTAISSVTDDSVLQIVYEQSSGRSTLRCEARRGSFLFFLLSKLPLSCC